MGIKVALIKALFVQHLCALIPLSYESGLIFEAKYMRRVLTANV